jgi:hypothetical protein
MVGLLNKSTNQRADDGGRFGALSVFAGFSCFLSLIQFLTIFVGVARIGFSQPLAIGVVAVSVAVALLFATRFRDANQPARRTNRRSSDWAVRVLGAVVKALAVVAIAWAAWVWLQLWRLASLRPPYDWDGLYYHLPAIHEWVTAGRVSWIGHIPDIPFVNFPMGVEVTSFFVHHLLQTSRWVNAGNLPYWPLAFLALVVIAKRIGVRGVWSWAAGALIVSAPVFVSQSVSCYIDPGFAATVMACIAASCVFVFDTKENRSRWWDASLLGLTVGLALGSKGTGLPFAIVVVVVSALGALWVWGSKRRLLVTRLGVVVAVSLLVGGYWYTRNAILAGNPIYPIQLSVGGKVLIEGWDHVQFTDANLPPWLVRYPGPSRMFVSWLQRDRPISGYAPVGGMGYVWLAGAVPAVLLLWLLTVGRRYPGPVRQFAFVTILVVCLLVAQPATWWARFTVWLHALGLPSIALVIYAAASARRLWWRTLAVVVAAGVVATAVWESGATLALEWADGRTGEVTSARNATFMTSGEYMFPGMAEATGFRGFFEAGKIARSPWERYGTLLGGVLAMPLDQREIVVLPMHPTETDIQALASRAVEWVIWDALAAGPPPAVIRNASTESYQYNPTDHVDFHILRLSDG